MLKKTENMILSVLVIFAVISVAASQFYDENENKIYCFQCNSNLDRDCLNLAPNDTQSFHYKPCLDDDKYNGSLPFCRKIVQRIMSRDNMEVVVRKCGWVKHPRLECYSFRNEDHMETSCQCFTAGCNPASSVSFSPALGASVLILCLVLENRFHWQ